jgi:lipoate-protein ligase A
MWSQTPQFDLLLNAKADIGITMNVHHGIVKTFDFENSGMTTQMRKNIQGALVGQKLQDIRNWTTFLKSQIGALNDWKRIELIAKRLDELLPIPKLAES